MSEDKNYVIGKPLDDYIKQKHTQEECIGFIDGYKAKQSEWMFTEEDLKNAIDMARETEEINCFWKIDKHSHSDIIEFLKDKQSVK